MMRERGILRYNGIATVLAVTVCVLLQLFVFPAYGAEGEEAPRRVFDQAGLFTEAEIQEYETDIQQLRESLEVDLVLVTAEDAEGKDSKQYANEFYESGEFGRGSDHDGILFLIDLDNRELAFSTEGAAARIFTDERLESMLDHAYERASEGDYSACAESFLYDAKYYGNKGIPVGQHSYDEETGAVRVHRSIRWYEFFMAFLVSGAVAGGACLNVKKEYGMEADERQLGQLHMAYRADSKFAFRNETDQLVNQFVTSRIIPRTTVHSSSGRGRSGGGSVAGRSTMHRSSSGRSHGGASRKF